MRSNGNWLWRRKCHIEMSRDDTNADRTITWSAAVFWPPLMDFSPGAPKLLGRTPRGLSRDAHLSLSTLQTKQKTIPEAETEGPRRPRPDPDPFWPVRRTMFLGTPLAAMFHEKMQIPLVNRLLFSHRLKAPRTVLTPLLSDSTPQVAFRGMIWNWNHACFCSVTKLSNLY